MANGWKLTKTGWHVVEKAETGLFKFLFGGRASPREIPNFLSCLSFEKTKSFERPWISSGIVKRDFFVEIHISSWKV